MPFSTFFLLEKKKNASEEVKKEEDGDDIAYCAYKGPAAVLSTLHIIARLILSAAHEVGTISIPMA